MNQGRIFVELDENVYGVEELWNEIFLTEESAMMPQRILAELPTYSHGVPTDQFQGRLWKKHYFFANSLVIDKEDGKKLYAPERGYVPERGYLLCWMDKEVKKSTDYTVYGKPIQILDWKKLFNIS